MHVNNRQLSESFSCSYFCPREAHQLYWKQKFMYFWQTQKYVSLVRFPQRINEQYNVLNSVVLFNLVLELVWRTDCILGQIFRSYCSFWLLSGFQFHWSWYLLGPDLELKVGNKVLCQFSSFIQDWFQLVDGQENPVQSPKCVGCNRAEDFLPS